MYDTTQLTRYRREPGRVSSLPTERPLHSINSTAPLGDITLLQLLDQRDRTGAGEAWVSMTFPRGASHGSNFI